jgi:hypothetical protein
LVLPSTALHCTCYPVQSGGVRRREEGGGGRREEEGGGGRREEEGAERER